MCSTCPVVVAATWLQQTPNLVVVLIFRNLPFKYFPCRSHTLSYYSSSLQIAESGYIHTHIYVQRCTFDIQHSTCNMRHATVFALHSMCSIQHLISLAFLSASFCSATHLIYWRTHARTYTYTCSHFNLKFSAHNIKYNFCN